MITTDLFIYRKEQIMNLAFWSVSLALSALMAGWEAYRVITRDNRTRKQQVLLVLTFVAWVAMADAAFVSFAPRQALPLWALVVLGRWPGETIGNRIVRKRTPAPVDS